MGRKKDKKAKKPKKSGGITFFLSLFALLFIGLCNTLLLPGLWDSYAFTHLSRFAIGGIIGAWAAHFFISGRISVLIHEFEHALMSNFVGNKWKGMKVKKDSGHFEYSYTKKTAAYNAFIALAPYWLPVFTTLAIAVALPIWWGNHALIVLVVGVGYGIDFMLNIRDISPVQTDLTQIRGGYRVGCFYVFVINLAVTTTLLAWVLQESFGLKYLAFGIWDFMLTLVAHYY